MQDNSYPRWIRRLASSVWVLTRGLTITVRALVVNKETQEVLLVRHRLMRGWHLPGGGLERNETVAQAITRELREEANVVVHGHIHQRGMFHQPWMGKRDHVLLCEVMDFTIIGPRTPDWEIAEARFFPLSALPEDVAKGSLARILEYRDTLPPSDYW